MTKDRISYQGLRKSTIRPTQKEAKLAESDLLRELKAPAGQAAEAGQVPVTLKALFEAYVQGLVDRGKPEDTVVRAAQTARVVERVTPDLLARPVSRITDADIFAFRQARAREERFAVVIVNGEERQRRLPATKPATINRDLRTIRAMLKQVRPDYRFPSGAFSSEDETRVRWLRPEEELLVLDTMRSPFREIAKVAALTLMRMTEIRLLRREDVHLEQGVIMLPKAKSGARAVVLSESAQKVLRGQLDAHHSEWVFPSPAGRPYDRSYIGRTFRRSAREAGLRDFRFHDLRHHGATMALNKGFTAPIVMALGGWKTERMMRRYAAVTDETLRRAAEAVSGNEEWQRPGNLAPGKATP